MADQPMRLRSDADLEAALRELAQEIAWPSALDISAQPDGSDLAAVVRLRIQAAPRPSGDTPRMAGALRSRWSWRPAPRALVAALLILLALAAVAGGAVLGLPGLRLILGPAPGSPPPSLGPSSSPVAIVSASPGQASDAPGSALGLGELVALQDLDARAGFTVTWPSDPVLGPPDAAYVSASLGGQVGLVWRSAPSLGPTLGPDVGLVLTEFRGKVDGGFFSKAMGNGTTAETVTVHGEPGFWITGDPHLLFYTGPSGLIYDERRWVGDALLWSNGPITYRLETSLGRAAALRLAGSMF